MFERKKIQDLNDFFIELNNRREKGVYFYRINGFNEKISLFIQKYYEAARHCGVIVEGRIPNPDEKSLSYYQEIMGLSFQMDLRFISASLKKWLPRMNDVQRNNVASAMYKSLDNMRKKGKNENMLKNAYIKLMCGLYYKCERIVNQLGLNQIPKILYEGEISSYELMLVSLLSSAGCDVVLLQYRGDGNYLKVDPRSEQSDNLQMPNMTAFPNEFNLKWVRTELENKLNNERLYGEKPDFTNCTNAWIEGKGLSDILKPVTERGSDSRFFYNCFIKINGVEDKVSYLNDLYQFQLELKNNKRRLVIIEDGLQRPTNEEISSITRGNYNKQDIMLMNLSKNLNSISNNQLRRIIVKAFIDILLEASKIDGMNLNRLTNKAVYLLCWIKRYYSQLFASWKPCEISCFIYMGGCQSENEAMFLRFLSRLPVDVLILKPNLDSKCCLADGTLYEINNQLSLSVDRFPTDGSEIQMGTAAYHAERELDTLMYQDSGMYRNRQYVKATAVTLQTMYEEVALLWDQEIKYRPNFSIANDVVNMPVIFAKASGVKNGDVQQYWADVKKLLVDNTFIVGNVPFINPNNPNPIRAVSAEFFKNGRLQRDKIKQNKYYQYGFLREEVQDYILDKLSQLINSRLIKGTFENGTEYNIISTILNMPKDIVRMIQKFDFTKKNPKLVYIYTSENFISIEDAILTLFLNLVGFDVIFFVPTGYQCVEKYFNKQILEEHQCGDYMYDLRIPNFQTISADNRPWHKKFFRKGN